MELEPGGSTSLYAERTGDDGVGRMRSVNQSTKAPTKTATMASPGFNSDAPCSLGRGRKMS